MTGYAGGQVFGAIREIFQVFDTNGDKTLDAAELRHAFACMVRTLRQAFADAVLFISGYLHCILNADLCVQGMILTEAELQGIIATHDLDRNGVFDEVLCTTLFVAPGVSFVCA